MTIVDVDPIMPPTADIKELWVLAHNFMKSALRRMYGQKAGQLRPLLVTIGGEEAEWQLTFVASSVEGEVATLFTKRDREQRIEAIAFMDTDGSTERPLVMPAVARTREPVAVAGTREYAALLAALFQYKPRV